MPVSTPVVAAMLATDVLLLAQVPPDAASVRVMVEPVHTEAGPEMVPADGNGPTVIDVVAMPVPQAVMTTYDMVAVPAPTPVTMPVVPMVAMVVLLLRQLPPVVASASVVVAPWQTVVAPVIVPADGVVFIVTVAVMFAVPQELVRVYVMPAVPLETPVTTPVALTVAMAALLLLQVPPERDAVRVFDAPTHMVVVPVTVADEGAGITVTTAVAVAVPQLLVTA